MQVSRSIFCFTVLLYFFNALYLGTQVLGKDKGLNTNITLKEIAQLAKATGSYHAEFITITEKKGVSKTAIGHLKYKWPNKSWREIRRQRDGVLMGRVISNGKIKWNYIPIGNLALKYDLESLDEDAQQKGWGSAADLDERTLEYVRKGQFDAEEVYVLEGSHSDLLKQNDPAQPGKVRVFIGAKDGIIRKMVTYNIQGKEIGTQVFHNIQQDLSISDREFEFIPPVGTKVHEMKNIGPKIHSSQ